jgi:hypothetical protein
MGRAIAAAHQRTENTAGGKTLSKHTWRREAGAYGRRGARNTDPGRCLGTPEPAAIPARSDLARGCADRLAGVERRCRWRAASSLAAHTSLPPFSQSPLCCCAGDDLAWAGLALDLIGFPSTTAHSPLSPLRTPRRPFCCRGLFPLESRLAQLLAASKH